jgi:ribosomal protein S18 acetylase RimI-like enzyme
MDEGRPMELTVSQRADTGKLTAAEMDLSHNFDQALPSDLEGVQQLELEAYGDHAYSYVVLRQFLDMTGELFQVCRDANGNVIAYGVIARSINQDSGWFHSLVVSTAHQRKGIGTELSEKLLNKADSHSLKELFLTVEPDNKTAISLYKKLGFIDVKFEPHYYGKNEGRIIMHRYPRRQQKA